MNYKQKYLINKNSESSNQNDTYKSKYYKYKQKYLILKNQFGSSVSKQKNFGKRIDGEIETVDWSKEDYMTKDTPVGTLFTTGSVRGIVFRIIKIVDGPTETETKTVNNNDGTVKQVLQAVKTVDRICTVAINLSTGNIDGLR